MSSNLARAPELCDGAPTWTTEEKERIHDYDPGDRRFPMFGMYRRRPGQKPWDASRERREWFAAHARDLDRMERMFS